MTYTRAELREIVNTAWRQLDPLEIDLLTGAYDSMELKRPISKGEKAALTRFAELCGIPDAAPAIDEILGDIAERYRQGLKSAREFIASHGF